MAANVLELTEDNFDTEVLNSSKPVIVDFWAAWCGPCKMMAPVIEDIGKEYKDKYKVAKLNVDDAMGIATRFNVMNIPTLVFFKQGSEITRMVGAVSKRDISKKIEELFVS